MVALTLIVVAAGAAWAGQAWFRPRHQGGTGVEAPVPEPPPPPEKKKAMPKHPPVTAVRDRMLVHFHGRATDIFTDLPGFGYERLTPLYKKVPYQVPYFSPDEVENDKGPARPGAPLQAVFTESLNAFQAPEQPAVKKDAEGPGTTVRPKDGFGPGTQGAVSGGLQLRVLDLIGLLDRQRPKAYSGGPAFELAWPSMQERQEASKEKSTVTLWSRWAIENRKPPAAPETRPLDMFEAAGVEELLKGKSVFIRTKGRTTRMLGALRAGDQCLECHPGSAKNDLLGAFSYTFVDASRREGKE